MTKTEELKKEIDQLKKEIEIQQALNSISVISYEKINMLMMKIILNYYLKEGEKND